MLVKKVMIRHVEPVRPDDTLSDAAARMRACQVDLLPVCEGDRLVGMVTDRSIAEHAATVGLPAGRSRIRDAMNPNVIWCYENQDLEDAARSVERHADDQTLPAFLVLDDKKQLVGLLPSAVFRMDYARYAAGAEWLDETIVPFEEDSVDHMSDGSFPASDPLPPPSTVSPSHGEGPN